MPLLRVHLAQLVSSWSLLVSKSTSSLGFQDTVLTCFSCYLILFFSVSFPGSLSSPRFLNPGMPSDPDFSVSTYTWWSHQFHALQYNLHANNDRIRSLAWTPLLSWSPSSPFKVPFKCLLGDWNLTCLKFNNVILSPKPISPHNIFYFSYSD